MNAEAAFANLYHENYSSVLRFIERRIDPERASDICAECFEIAWRKFDPASPPGLPWLYQTARNLLGNAYRRRHRDAALFERLVAEFPADTTADHAEVLDALRRLSASEREVVELTYWEGLSAADVGKVVGCTEQAAWKRISRAKERMRSLLEPDQVSATKRVIHDA